MRSRVFCALDPMLRVAPVLPALRVLPALPVLLGFLALAGCRKDAAETKSPVTEARAAAEPAVPHSVRLSSAALAEAGIRTWRVQPTDLEHVLVLSGKVSYDENAVLQVASNVRGRVAAIPVDLGASVHKGDVLLWIESIEASHARDAYVRATVELRVAGRAYERARALAEAKALSLGELQSREGVYLAKKAEAETAERALQLLGESGAEIAALRASLDRDDPRPLTSGPQRQAVRAPFDGTVVDRKVTPGALVEALQPLATVADLAKVWVFLQAYEKDLALVHKGLPVTIRAEAYPAETFAGRVDFLASEVDEPTRTVRVRATVDNRARKLLPGLFVRAQVEVPRPEAPAHLVLAVPQAALQTLEGKTHLFVATGPGLFVRRAVETGHTFEGFTEVLAGVKAGEDVVTEGSFVLKSEFAKATLAEED